MLNKSDFMKLSSHNFIENEKLDHVENILIKNDINETEDVCATNKFTTTTRSHDALPLENEKLQRRFRTDDFKQETFTKEETLLHPPLKRFVTTCFIKPIHVPYWFSESLHLKIGSNVKHYDEKIHFKCKYIPYHWKESMSTLTPQTGEPFVYKSYLEIPVKTDYHYMSLESQQFSAEIDLEQTDM